MAQLFILTVQNHLSRERLSSPLFYCCLLGGISLYFILSFLFAEKLQANNGLGWDGLRYADLAKNLMESKELDSYLIMRIIPSAWVHIFFKLFSIEFTPQNIINGFEVLNLISILLGTYFTKRIMEHFDIQPMLQVVGLMLLIVNYAVLNFTVYYPVMTDSAALALGTALLYFFVRKEMLNIWLVSLLGFFTWPTIGVTGIILLLLPFNSPAAEEKTLPFTKRLFLPTLAFLYITSVCVFHVYFKQSYKPMAFTLKLDTALAPLSIVTLGLTVFWWTTWINRLPLYSVSFWKKAINFPAIIGVVAIGLIVFLVKNIKELPSHEFFNEFILTRSQITLAAVKPFISVVCHANYYGAIIILLLLFSRSVSQNIRKIGIGFSVAIVFNLILFGIMTESRAIINFLPWLIVLFVVSVNHLNFKYYMFIPTLLFNLLSSKVWLKIGDVSNSGFNADGTISFPFQKFFMNLGPWMSTQMWQVFLLVFIAAVIVNFLAFYSIKFAQGKIGLTKRFEEIEQSF